MSRLTKIDAARGIERLKKAGYVVPKDAGVDGTADAWAEFLGDLDHADVAEAITRYIRDGVSDGDGQFWPKPGKIRWLVKDLRSARPGEDPMQSSNLAVRYRGWELRDNQHDRTGCPVCGAMMQPVASQSGRLFVLHDAAEHERQQIPHLGLPYPKWAQDMYDAADRVRAERDARREKLSPAAWRAQQASQMQAVMKRVGDILGGSHEAAD